MLILLLLKVVFFFFLQEWSLTETGYVKHHDLCLTLTDQVPGAVVVMKPCQNVIEQVTLTYTFVLVFTVFDSTEF